MDAVRESWQHAFEVESERAMSALLADYLTLFQDLLDDADVPYEYPFVSPATVRMGDARRSVVAKVKDSDAALLLSPVVHAATNAAKAVTARLVGDCPRCRRPAPLEPAIRHPRDPGDHRKATAMLGEAMLRQRPSDTHDCVAAMAAAVDDGYRAGTYV